MEALERWLAAAAWLMLVLAPVSAVKMGVMEELARLSAAAQPLLAAAAAALVRAVKVMRVVVAAETVAVKVMGIGTAVLMMVALLSVKAPRLAAAVPLLMRRRWGGLRRLVPS